MLKQLIQLFAEKFLVSKKTWVSNQSQALVSGGTDISYSPSQGEQDYTAPSDGVVCLNVTGAQWVRLYSKTNSLRAILQHTPEKRDAYKQFILQVAKGETIVINISADYATANIKFIPTIGS